MKVPFEIRTSTKIGLHGRERYIVTRGRTGYLRIVGDEPQWLLMTATADEDDGRIRRCSDQLRLVEAAMRLGKELNTAPTLEKDWLGREYVKIGLITRDSVQTPDEFENENNAAIIRFFELFDQCTDLRTRGNDEMRKLYDEFSLDNEGGDVYLSDGVWLSSDGSLSDRGR